MALFWSRFAVASASAIAVFLHYFLIR